MLVKIPTFLLNTDDLLWGRVERETEFQLVFRSPNLKAYLTLEEGSQLREVVSGKDDPIIVSSSMILNTNELQWIRPLKECYELIFKGNLRLAVTLEEGQALMADSVSLCKRVLPEGKLNKTTPPKPDPVPPKPPPVRP